MTEIKIPKEIIEISSKLMANSYEAYLVGGCVRDIFLDKEPKDWDIATNAKPEEIQKIFPESVYENNFGTVGVKANSENPNLKVIEITTYRLEGRYTDKRHPDKIKFAKKIEDDLSRRDFTINAMAMEIQNSNLKNQNNNSKFKIIDPWNGQKNLKDKLIVAVGNPQERFQEDALRLIRAVRFAAQLDFKIEDQTANAIKYFPALLQVISEERIRDEFIKIIMAPRAAEGVQMLEDLGLLQYIIPELREGIGINQNKHHIYAVWEHNLRALDYAVKNNYSLEVRLASLLHDVGKPKTKRGEGLDATFYNHEIVGARMALKILDNLHFSKSVIERVVHLVRFHLFYYNVGEVTEAGVRRFLARVGPENVDDFIKIREADRIGSGVPKAVPYKIRHLLFMIEKVKQDPISPKMLKVSGEDVMRIAGITPGPKVGQILSVLLEEVLDDPQNNSKEYLELKIQELNKLPEKRLAEMMEKAKGRKEEFEGEVEGEMKKKYYVK